MSPIVLFVFLISNIQISSFAFGVSVIIISGTAQCNFR